MRQKIVENFQGAIASDLRDLAALQLSDRFRLVAHVPDLHTDPRANAGAGAAARRNAQYPEFIVNLEDLPNDRAEKLFAQTKSALTG